MSQKYKIISLFLVILMLFMVSLITYYNDLIGYTIVFAALTLVCLIYLLILLFHKKDKKSNYKREINKILKLYNSSIVKMNDNYELINENVVNAKNIEDLFELSNELNNPILYLEEENAGIFLIQYGNDILYYILKENDDDETNFEREINIYKLEKEKQKDDELKLLLNIDKTTIIQMKNNKFYKIKPIRK